MSQRWPMVPLGEVLAQDREYIAAPEPRDYPKLSVKLYGKGVTLDAPADGSQLKMKRHQLARARQVILSEIWGKKGAIGLVPPEGDGALCTSHFFLFNVLGDRVLSAWLQNIFRSNYLAAQLDASAFGTTGYAAVRPKDLLAATIPLPPLPEQRRIVAKVEELAAKIEEGVGLRRRAQDEIEWLAMAALRLCRERLLGGEYRVVRLGEVTTVTAGGTPSRDNPGYWGGDIQWVKTGELIDSDISSAEERITEAGLNNSSAKLFPPDTILIALYGQGQTRGRTGRLVVEAATNQACCAILPIPDLLEPRYTQYWLRSLYYELREECYGGAQPNWSGRMVKFLKIAMPPLTLQRRIVAYLDDLQARVDSLKAMQAQSAAELDALLLSILDKAFKGEL